jgi:hypothetical protein
MDVTSSHLWCCRFRPTKMRSIRPMSQGDDEAGGKSALVHMVGVQGPSGAELDCEGDGDRKSCPVLGVGNISKQPYDVNQLAQFPAFTTRFRREVDSHDCEGLFISKDGGDSCPRPAALTSSVGSCSDHVLRTAKSHRAVSLLHEPRNGPLASRYMVLDESWRIELSFNLNKHKTAFRSRPP